MSYLIRFCEWFEAIPLAYFAGLASGAAAVVVMCMVAMLFGKIAEDARAQGKRKRKRKRSLLEKMLEEDKE